MEKIAVIDDDPSIVEVFSDMLTAFDFQPSPYLNPVEALERIPGEKPLPSLILLDLMMVPITGLQFLEERRKNETLKAIPVFIVSAWDLPEDDRKRFGSEISCVIRKPILPKDLVNLIRTKLDRGIEHKSGADSA
ncbi:response regulator [Methanoregula sp.]|uniref:response regulator n=1 Tax=Methanoregula sp. TaxID=2052170 RepID=UPI002C24A8CD|nr:response regulator [Methanoregula sp.]HVP96780.1 response regulator [Methanoregula sp.]